MSTTTTKDGTDGFRAVAQGARDLYYPDAPRGITATHQDQLNADLLAFIRSNR